MRLPVIAVIYIAFVCGVTSTDFDDDEPHLKIMARSTVYNVGETRAIFCKGRNLPEKMNWYSPSGNKIEERSSKNTRVFVERRVEDTSDVVPLIIHNINLTDGGNWTCKSGDISETIEFIVGEKANLSVRNETKGGEEGKSVRLTCPVKGHPAPVVFWYKDGAREAISGHIKTKYIIRQDHTLEIKNLNYADVGVYVCKVRQKLLSHYTDKTIYLSVKHKPVLYNNSTKTFYTSKFKVEEIYAIINDTKNITCSAVADPLPIFYWYRRHESYDEDLIEEEDTIVTSEDGMHSTLILRMYNEDALGEYKCTANNSKGSESVIFHVSRGDRPDPPDFVSLVNANASSLTFNVSCSTCLIELDENVTPDPQNLTILGYKFELVPVQEGYPPEWDQAEKFDVDIISANDTLFTIGPLSNSTEFHVRVSTRNSAGFSDWFTVPENPKTTSSAAKLSVTLVEANVSSLTFKISCPICFMKQDDDLAPDEESYNITGLTIEIAPVKGDRPVWDQAKKFDTNIVNANETIFTIGPLPVNSQFSARIYTRRATETLAWFKITDILKTTNEAVTLSFSCTSSSSSFFIIISLLAVLCYLL